MFESTFLSKFFKVFITILFVLFGLFYGLFYFFTSPKSDKKILSEFKDVDLKPRITHHDFNNFKYRKLIIINDTVLPTIFFVHGTIGSCADFIEYIKDSMVYSKANFVSYDRVGYNYDVQNEVQESIAFERDMLQSITKDLPKKKIVVFGYSCGGPIVLADTTRYKKAVLLAPAVFSSKEVMPLLLSFYKWRATRWLIPPIWKQASKKKLSHQKDLSVFEKNWSQNKNDILVVHGDKDKIVPFDNATFLKTKFPKEKFDLVQVRTAGHGLIWSKYEFILEQLILSLN